MMMFLIACTYVTKAKRIFEKIRNIFNECRNQRSTVSEIFDGARRFRI